jgi:hypothetical protein
VSNSVNVKKFRAFLHSVRIDDQMAQVAADNQAAAILQQAARHSNRLNERIGTIRLRFVRGRNLINRVGGREDDCSEAFVKVIDVRDRQIHQTATGGRTVNPEWADQKENRTSLRVVNPEGAVRFLVWDKRSDAPLGEVAIPVVDAVGYSGVVNFQLHPRENEEDELLLKHKGNLGTVSVHFHFTFEPLTAAQDLDVGTVHLPCLVDFTVSNAAGLNNFGRSKVEPYVRVLAPNGSQLLRTGKSSSKGEAKWDKGNRGSLRVKHGSVGNVTFQVLDAAIDADKPEALLGEVQVPLADAAKLGTPAKAVTLILRARERETVEHIASASDLGTVTVQFSAATETITDEAQEAPGTLTLTVDACRDLILRRVGARLQPYIKILNSEGALILESQAYDTEANCPEFPLNAISAKMRVYSDDGSITIQTWDKQRGTDAFLGEVRVKFGDALRYASSAETVLQLLPREGEPDTAIKRNQDKLGSIVLNFRFKNESHLLHPLPSTDALTDADPPGRLSVRILAVTNIRQRSVAHAAPYVTIRDPRRDEVLRTAPQTDASDLDFLDGSAEAIFRIARRRGLLTIRVWNSTGTDTDDELLGEVLVPVDFAIKYQGINACKFALRPREHERDKWLIEHEGSLGQVTMKFDFEADQCPPPPAGVDVPDKINGVFTFTIVSARNLCNFETTGISDPYVKVLRNRTAFVHRTSRCKATLNPVWTTRNVCDVAASGEAARAAENAIAFQVWDSNTLLDELMGEALLPLADAYRYATLSEGKTGTKGSDAADPRVFSIPLRVPRNERKEGSKLQRNEHQLGVLDVRVEFTPGDDKKSAAEVERARLFAMDLPLQYVIDHIERTHEGSQLSRELMLYLPFLIMFVFFSLARRDTLQEHYIANGFKQQFTSHEIPPTLYHETPNNERFNGLDHYVGYWELQTMRELNMWIQGVVAPQFWDWRHPHEPSKTYGPFGFNKAIGAVRMRAFKVRPDSCEANPAFIPENSSSYNLACFSNFDTEKLLTDPLFDPDTNLTVNYQNGCDYSFVYIVGDIYTYPCGGHVVDLPLSSSFNQTLTTLRNLDTIGYNNDTDTRFFILEWFTYNPALDMFTSSKYFLEITNGGGWIPTAQLRSFRVASGGPGFLVYDIFFTMFVAYYWIKFFRDWHRHYRRTKSHISYIVSVWTLLEIANLVIFVVALVFHFEWYAACADYVKRIPEQDPDHHPEELNYIMNIFYGEIFANACNSVLSFLKILKFLKMNSKLNILTRTMGRAAENIVGVIAIFFLIMTAYALSGVQLYGSVLFEFRNVDSAMSVLFRALMGDFDYEELRNKNRATTFLYFWSFIVIGLFVMLNFITAIIGSAYEQEQDAERTLPVAVQLRRTIREFRALTPRVVINSFVQSVILRTRRHPDDIIFEHLTQYRTALLQRDGLDPDAVDHGDETAPQYLINHYKFKAMIPNADLEYITEPVADNQYLAIAEDYCVLYHDEEQEKEDALGTVFKDTIATGFRRVLVDRFDEIQKMQRSLLDGTTAVIRREAADATNDGQDARADAERSAVSRAGANKRGAKHEATLADVAVRFRKGGAKHGGGEGDNEDDEESGDGNAVNSDDELEEGTTMFDPESAVTKLFAAIDQATKNARGAELKRLESVPEPVRVEQRRLAKLYIEDHIGVGHSGGGVIRAREEADKLDQLLNEVYDLACVRSYPLLANVSEDTLRAAASRHGAQDDNAKAEASAPYKA